MLKSVALALCLLAVAGNSDAQQVIGGCSILPANSVWNTPVDTLPVLANSSSMVNTIGASRGFHADFGAGMWDGGPIGIPFITVNGSQAKHAASFLYDDESDPGPYAIPLNVPIEGGANGTGDRHAIALDTTNCILYEFFRAFPNSSSWTADSGAIYDLKSNALRPSSWTSADAAGLPILPGLVTYDEVLSGEITHAIRFTAPQTRRDFVWPARHYASSLTGTQYPRMGERFRLKASFDISGFPADIQVILRAMKKYGIILADNGSSWFISGAPDSRWNDDNLHRLGQLLGSNFEAVDATVLRLSADSGAAVQSGVNLVVSPASVSLRLDQTQTFSATLTGATGGVTWSVNNVNGGDAVVGTIDTTGRYTPPSAVPSPGAVTVRATSVSTPTASASAAVSLLPVPVPPAPTPPPSTPPPATPPPAPPPPSPVVEVSISISPSSASMRLRQNKTFSATISGTSNKAKIWKVNGIVGGNVSVGMISAKGVYRAPNSVPSGGAVLISATSVADPTKSAVSRVTLRR